MGTNKKNSGAKKFLKIRFEINGRITILLKNAGKRQFYYLKKNRFIKFEVAIYVISSSLPIIEWHL